MTATDKSHQEPSEANTAGPVRFVEELADEHDYWMSLTDAARITRTSFICYSCRTINLPSQGHP